MLPKWLAYLSCAVAVFIINQGRTSFRSIAPSTNHFFSVSGHDGRSRMELRCRYQSCLQDHSLIHQTRHTMTQVFSGHYSTGTTNRQEPKKYVRRTACKGCIPRPLKLRLQLQPHVLRTHEDAEIIGSRLAMKFGTLAVSGDPCAAYLLFTTSHIANICPRNTWANTVGRAAALVRTQ